MDVVGAGVKRTAGRRRAGLDALWASVFELYAFRPAVGTLGAAAVGLALAAEEVVYRNPADALCAISRAREVLQDLGVPTA